MENKKILLVEDDRFLRELYLDLLKNAGYTVETAEDGKAGYEKIKTGGWDLVLLDIMLPKIDGCEIMRRLKKEPAINHNKKVIFITNLDDQKRLKEIKELGDGVLIKSDLVPDVFLEKVKGYL